MTTRSLGAAAGLCALLVGSCESSPHYVYFGVGVTASFRQTASLEARVEGEITVTFTADGSGNALALDAVRVSVGELPVTLDSLEFDATAWPVTPDDLDGQRTRLLRFRGRISAPAGTCDAMGLTAEVEVIDARGYCTPCSGLGYGPSVSGLRPSALDQLPVSRARSGGLTSTGLLSDLVLAADDSVWLAFAADCADSTLSREGLSWQLPLEKLHIAADRENGVIAVGRLGQAVECGGPGGPGAGGSGMGGSGMVASGTGGSGMGGSGMGGSGMGGSSALGGTTVEAMRIRGYGESFGGVAWQRSFEGQPAGYRGEAAVATQDGLVLLTVHGPRGLVLDGAIVDLVPGGARYLVVLEELTGALVTFERLDLDVAVIRPIPGGFALLSSTGDDPAERSVLFALDTDLTARWTLEGPFGASRLATHPDGSLLWATEADQTLRRLDASGVVLWQVQLAFPQSLAATDAGGALAGGFGHASLVPAGGASVDGAISPCGDELLMFAYGGAQPVYARFTSFDGMIDFGRLTL